MAYTTLQFINIVKVKVFNLRVYPVNKAWLITWVYENRLKTFIYIVVGLLHHSKINVLFFHIMGHLWVYCVLMQFFTNSPSPRHNYSNKWYQELAKNFSHTSLWRNGKISYLLKEKLKSKHNTWILNLSWALLLLPI